MVNGYQVDTFFCTLFAECFIARSHIYPGFKGKLSTSTNFPLEVGCEDCSFLDQTVEDFEHGLDSNLTDSVNTLELDVSLDEADMIPSSASPNFICSFGTVSDTFRLQLAPSIKCYKLWCQARVLLFLVLQAGKIFVSF